MFRYVLAVAAAAMIGLGASAPAAAANNPPKIGLVQIDLSNPFHLGEVDGAKEAARRFGFQLIVTSGEGDVNKQVQAVENLINEGVDAIAVNFIDAGAFGPTMKKAAAAGVPIVCLHSRIDGCAAVLGFDERHTGNIVGEYAAKLLKAKHGEVKGEVANLQGLLGQGLNTDRSGGIHRRDGEISGRQGRCAGSDRLGSDQGGRGHRELDDRLPQSRTDLWQ